VDCIKRSRNMSPICAAVSLHTKGLLSLFELAYFAIQSEGMDERSR
jgi:hypothetical protein